VLNYSVPIYMAFYVKRELEYRPSGPLAPGPREPEDAAVKAEQGAGDVLSFA
jgi:hypothetical protein